MGWRNFNLFVMGKSYRGNPWENQWAIFQPCLMRGSTSATLTGNHMEITSFCRLNPMEESSFLMLSSSRLESYLKKQLLWMVSSSHSNPIEIQCLIVKTCVSMFFHVFPTIFLRSARHLWCWLKCWRWVKPGALDAGPPGNPRGLQLCHFNCWSSCGLKKTSVHVICSVLVQ